MRPCAKFQVSSCTDFGDMFEGVPNFIRVTWLRPLLAKICICAGLVCRYRAECQISSACYCLARSTCHMHRSARSRVIFVDSVTILFLPFFLDWFDNLNHFKENLAPMYLSKVTTNFARARYSKWPPPPSDENMKWNISGTWCDRRANEVSFSTKSDMLNPMELLF